MNHKKGLPVKGICFICGCSDACACEGGCDWVNRDHTICSKCAEKMNKYMLQRVAFAAISVARASHCRVSEGADIDYALVYKVPLNRLKRELRKYAPGCLGKE